MEIIRADAKERLEHPLDAVIEPEIGRTFGIVVSEEDFSQAGEMELKPASINGKETDSRDVAEGLALAHKLVAEAATGKDRAKEAKTRRRRPTPTETVNPSSTNAATSRPLTGRRRATL